MRMKRTVTMLLNVLMVCTLCLMLPSKTAQAVAATTVTIDGKAVTGIGKHSGVGWDLIIAADQTTLTLHNYNGSCIVADYDMNVVLVGDNTINEAVNHIALYAFSMQISGSGSLQITHGYAGQSATANGLSANNLTISGARVTVDATTGNAIHTITDLCLQNGAVVNGTGHSAGAYGVWSGGAMLVTSGSRLTGIGMNSTFGIRSIRSSITVSGSSSSIRGTGLEAGIAAQNGIEGIVTEPAGGIIGSHFFPIPRFTVQTVLDGVNGGPAASAALTASPPTPPDVPKTGDGMPLMLLVGLILLSGTGLTSFIIAHRKKQPE